MHIAFIMDGNRRWAVENGYPKMKGHSVGVEAIKKITRACAERNIEAITFWALSTDNLKKRSESELKHLFSLINKLPEFVDEFIKNNARIHIIGDLSKLPEKTAGILEEMMEKTKEHTGMFITFAINYGGRDELMRTYGKLIEAGARPEDITEEKIDSMLDTAPLPEVDMIIRTGGDQRMSGFLPWQSIYAEYYFTPTKWPAFSETELDEAIAWFGEQRRNKGK